MADRTRKDVVADADRDANPDPITGAPGAHPVGVGVGAAGAGAAGAAIGMMAGPVGAAVGAAIGAVAGGYAGKAVAESIDPTAEDAYWRENYKSRSYIEPDTEYDVYRPAYQHGWEARSRNPDRSFDDLESDLERDWETSRGESNLEWNRARLASRDAFDRIETSSSSAAPVETDVRRTPR